MYAYAYFILAYNNIALVIFWKITKEAQQQDQELRAHISMTSMKQKDKLKVARGFEVSKPTSSAIFLPGKAIPPKPP